MLDMLALHASLDVTFWLGWASLITCIMHTSTLELLLAYTKDKKPKNKDPLNSWSIFIDLNMNRDQKQEISPLKKRQIKAEQFL